MYACKTAIQRYEKDSFNVTVSNTQSIDLFLITESNQKTLA